MISYRMSIHSLIAKNFRVMCVLVFCGNDECIK
jgi:hypothetical protein